jgi:acyl-coenzyme A synthetase/AMP-(fatty) acid ligase
MILEQICKGANGKIETSSHTFCYSQFESVLKLNSDIIEILKGVHVCLYKCSSFELARLIPILDGIASEVIILPETISSEHEMTIIEKNHVQYFVTIDVQNRLELITKMPTAQKNMTTFDIDHGTRWGIPTSGTTGAPKFVMHSMRSLTSSLVTKNKNANQSYTWALTYQVSRFAGLQVFLQALLTDSTLIVPEPNQSLQEQVNLFVDKQVNAMSATPSLWRKLLMLERSHTLKLARITLGGEIVDQKILNTLKAKFELAKIIHIYASTEAGVGFTVYDELEGIPYDYLLKGFNGIELKVDENDCLLIKKLDSDQYYKDNKLRIKDNDGFFFTGDKVKVEKNRILFLGRASGAINIGGNKVHPEEVESVITTHSAIDSCRVYSSKSSILGNLLQADLVLCVDAEDTSVIKKEVKHICQEKLSPYKIPYKFNFVESIDVNETGKILRRAI